MNEPVEIIDVPRKRKVRRIADDYLENEEEIAKLIAKREELKTELRDVLPVDRRVAATRNRWDTKSESFVEQVIILSHKADGDLAVEIIDAAT